MSKKPAITEGQEVPEIEEEDVASRIARLGAELAAVASDKSKRKAKLGQIESLLKSLSVEDFGELAEIPAVQSLARMIAGDLKPGETKNPGTVAEVSRDWTYRDLVNVPKKHVTAMEDTPINWNGLDFFLPRGVEMVIPEPIYDVYMEKVRAEQQREIHEAYMLGYSDVPPNHNFMNAETARVRLWSQMGPKPDPRQRRTGPISTGGSEPEATNAES